MTNRKYMMEHLLILSMVLTMSKAFMFDQLSSGLRCKGITMLCPPMCQKQDAQGCRTCDCTNIDPSHPNMPSYGNSGSNIDPSNPLSGHNTFPGSAGCADWTKCACVPTVNAINGCLECPCGQAQVSRITLPPTQPTVMTHPPPTTTLSSGSSSPNSKNGISASTTTATNSPVNTSWNQSNTKSTSPLGTTASSLPHSSATPQYMTPAASSKPVASTTSSTHTLSTVTSTKVDTNLPSVATTPALSTITSLLTTSTMAPFVCPGVFSCSLDCYAGFAMDKNGCPGCQCAPVPTDLP